MEEKEGIEVVGLEHQTDEPNVSKAKAPGKKAWNKAVDRISYAGIVKNMPYLIFLALLAIIYIANTNHAISLVREITLKKQKMKELHWRYMDLQSQLMYQTSESQLKLKTAALGLSPIKEPLFQIKIKTQKVKDN